MDKSSSNPSNRDTVNDTLKSFPYLHTFKTHLPEEAGNYEGKTYTLESLANKGGAPYGFSHSALGNTIKVPYVTADNKTGQPLYHVKITAKPLEGSFMQEPPQYVVMPSSDQKAQEAQHPLYIKDNSEIVAHMLPSHGKQPHIKIKPLHIGTNAGYGSSPLQYVGHRYINDHPSSHHEETVKPEEESLPKDTIVRRQLGKTAPIQNALSSEREKIYNWIMPLEKTEGKINEGEHPTNEEDGISANSSRGSLSMSQFQHVFTQATKQLHKNTSLDESSENGDPKNTQRILTSPSDEELGLPQELRPSILYAGVEHATPEFVGDKKPLQYKLHAIEIHQYVPIPGQPDPWMIKNNLDPSKMALFGPTQLPFDPQHSGMLAPTFQATTHEPLPLLSPEIARMLQQELETNRLHKDKDAKFTLESF
jgi:hypothetical protein